MSTKVAAVIGLSALCAICAVATLFLLLWPPGGPSKETYAGAAFGAAWTGWFAFKAGQRLSERNQG